MSRELVGGFAVDRLPPHAAATSASARPRRRRRACAQRGANRPGGGRRAGGDHSGFLLTAETDVGTGVVAGPANLERTRPDAKPATAADEPVGQHVHEQDEQRCRRSAGEARTGVARRDASLRHRLDRCTDDTTKPPMHRAEHRRGAADHDGDEELDRELEGLHLVGARRSRRTSTEHDPATAGVERARTRTRAPSTRATLMPTVCAAASWSRTAISDRPKRLRDEPTRRASRPSTAHGERRS